MFADVISTSAAQEPKSDVLPAKIQYHLDDPNVTARPIKVSEKKGRSKRSRSNSSESSRSSQSSRSSSRSRSKSKDKSDSDSEAERKEKDKKKIEVGLVYLIFFHVLDIIICKI